MGQVITKDPAMGQGTQHQMGGPMGGLGLIGGALMPRFATKYSYPLLFTINPENVV